MKKVLGLAVLIVAFAVAAYAGPYFVFEQYPLAQTPSITLTFGWDFDEPFINATNLSVNGDFFIVNSDLAVYGTPWLSGFDLDFVWCNGVGRDVFEVGLGMDLQLIPFDVDGLVLALSAIGRPSRVVTIYGSANWIYNVIGGLDFAPMIGLECRLW